VKRGGKESKLYVALVKPGSSAGVKYGHGLTRQKSPASPEQHIILIPYPLFRHIAYRHYITETDFEIFTSQLVYIVVS